MKKSFSVFKKFNLVNVRVNFLASFETLTGFFKWHMLR